MNMNNIRDEPISTLIAIINGNIQDEPSLSENYIDIDINMSNVTNGRSPDNYS